MIAKVSCSSLTASSQVSGLKEMRTIDWRFDISFSLNESDDHNNCINYVVTMNAVTFQRRIQGGSGCSTPPTPPPHPFCAQVERNYEETLNLPTNMLQNAPNWFHFSKFSEREPPDPPPRARASSAPRQRASSAVLRLLSPPFGKSWIRPCTCWTNGENYQLHII